jgi:hypothetical protein
MPGAARGCPRRSGRSRPGRGPSTAQDPSRLLVGTSTFRPRFRSLGTRGTTSPGNPSQGASGGRGACSGASGSCLGCLVPWWLPLQAGCLAARQCASSAELSRNAQDAGRWVQGRSAWRLSSRPCRVGEDRRPVAAVSLPGRRAGLEFVEKLLTSAMVALLDGTEREHATPASRTVASLVELATGSGSSAVQVRCWSRPTTTTRPPGT